MKKMIMMYSETNNHVKAFQKRNSKEQKIIQKMTTTKNKKTQSQENTSIKTILNTTVTALFQPNATSYYNKKLIVLLTLLMLLEISCCGGTDPFIHQRIDDAPTHILNNETYEYNSKDMSASYTLSDYPAETGTSSDTENAEVYSFTAKIILSSLASLTSLVTICGNLLVMSAFFLDRQIRNPTNYFLLSLSVSDFLIGLFSMPLYTLYLMLGVWPFGEVICNLWLSLDYTVCLTSIYTVLFITIDRFCSVKIPAKYRKWRTREKVLFMIAITWVIPMSLFFTSIFAWNYSDDTEFDPKNCDVGWSKNRYFNIGLVISYFWTTLAVMIVLYIFIYQVASKLDKRRRNEQHKVSTLVGSKHANNNNNTTLIDHNSRKIIIEFTKQNAVMDAVDDDACSSSYRSKNGDNKTALTIKKSDKDLNTGVQNETFDNKIETKAVATKPEVSSSMESHSDYDSMPKRNNSLVNNKSSSTNNNSSQQSNSHANTFDDDSETKELIGNSSSNQTLQLTRPENLAIMSHDVFAERKNEKNGINTKTPNGQNMPFIDDDFEELSYMLHRRQIDKEGKTPVKEETILIKTPALKQTFFQKLQSPLKSLSRRSSASKASNCTLLLNNSNVNSPNIELLKNNFRRSSNAISNGNNNNNNNKIIVNCISETNVIVEEKQPKIENVLPKIEVKSDTKVVAKNFVTNLSAKSTNLTTTSTLGINSTQRSLTNSDSNTTDSMDINNGKKNNNVCAKQDLDDFDSDNDSNMNSNSNFTNKPTSKSKSKKQKSWHDSSTTGAYRSTIHEANTDAAKLDLKDKRKAKHENRTRKSLRTITFILGAFMICLVPWHIVSVWNSFCDGCWTTNPYLLHVFNICYWLCYLNSPINPFMYALANQQFKKAFLRILKKDWRKL